MFGLSGIYIWCFWKHTAPLQQMLTKYLKVDQRAHWLLKQQEPISCVLENYVTVSRLGFGHINQCHLEFNDRTLYFFIAFISMNKSDIWCWYENPTIILCLITWKCSSLHINILFLYYSTFIWENSLINALPELNCVSQQNYSDWINDKHVAMVDYKHFGTSSAG